MTLARWRGLAALTLLLHAPLVRAAEPAAPVQPAQPLVFMAPANHAMPLADVRNGELRDGILKDLGEAIAARLGRPAQFVVIPSRRVNTSLARGEVDALCYVSPGWLDAGPLHWSRPLFDSVAIVAARAGTPALGQLADLRGERIGTVAGYRYRELDEALGPGWLRDDAPSMASNLAKLAAGRVRHAMTDQLSLAYAMKRSPQASLVPALTTLALPTHCAFSPARHLPLAAIDRAMDALVADGTVERILARYR